MPVSASLVYRSWYDRILIDRSTKSESGGLVEILQRSQFSVGPAQVNSRELCTIVMIATIVGAVFIFFTVAEVSNGVGKVSRLVGAGRMPHREELAALAKGMKSMILSLLSVAWVVGVTYTLAAHVFGRRPFERAETVLILFAVFVTYGKAATDSADKLWSSLRRDLSGLVILDAFLNLRTYSLLWEAVFLGVLILLRLIAWLFDLDKELDGAPISGMGCLLWGSFLVLVVAWVGPGLMFTATHWNANSASSVGQSLFLWIFYYPLLVLPPVAYRLVADTD